MIHFNRKMALWAIAVLQPASASDVRLLIRAAFPFIRESLDPETVVEAIAELRARAYVLEVSARGPFYSITAKGNASLSRTLSRSRDSARLFLMRQRRSDRVRQSGESIANDLGGVSPLVNERSDVKGAARPINPPGSSLESRRSGRIYRPRAIQQLVLPAGDCIDSPDIQLRYGSFASLAQVRAATAEELTQEKDLSQHELSLCMGISPSLMQSLIWRKERYYRSFEIPKVSGGVRRIDAPRVFLKSAQQWLAYYILEPWLPAHSACHSYQVGKSIQTNAARHLGQRFVGGLDIADFFGSISLAATRRMLASAGIGRKLSAAIAELCTLRNALPQGAPTSPILSNYYLSSFDEAMSDFAINRSLAYSRYADDITFSGSDRRDVAFAINQAGTLLEKFGLRVNDKKTRVVSAHSRQVVTGLVVNRCGLPPRELRRGLRAAIKRAEFEANVSADELQRIRGLFSYLMQFERLRDSRQLSRLKERLERLSARAHSES